MEGLFRITAVRQSTYPDLMEKYENVLAVACPLQVGQVFLSDGLIKPDGLCDSFWETLLPFLKKWREGIEEPIQGWMKDSRTLLLSCNDGFRPMSFLIERLEEK